MIEEKKSKVRMLAKLAALVLALLLGYLLLVYILPIEQAEPCGYKRPHIKTLTQILAEATMDTALGSEDTRKTVKLEIPECIESATMGFRLAKFSDPEYCRLCPGARDWCWQVIPIYFKEGSYYQLNDAISCIDLPRDIIIEQDKSDDCVKLSTNPCPPRDQDHCYASLSGVPDEVLQVSSWKTFGGEGTDAYTIRLTGTGELEARKVISVCVKPST